MKMLDDFNKCVNEIIDKDGRVSLSCKLGLWSVSSLDSDSVYLQAYHYWRQYAGDGEYSSIIGGKTVMENMIGMQK
tara:strand:- start:28517 stop:28744 length:228 start_codon:yes stop_codon:yes gene_type:complete